MSEEEAKFNFGDGTGEALGTLPCFTTVSTRGAAAKTLESALEPLHRLVYGRSGAGGSRREALSDFKGFPPAMEAEVAAKIGKLTKGRLADMVKTLGMAVKVSSHLAEVAAGVVAFLMAPKDEGRVKDLKAIAAAKKAEADAKKTKKAEKLSPTKAAAPATRKRPASTESEETKDDAPASSKRTKAEAPAAAASMASSSNVEPSEEAVLLAVYRGVLAMSYEERAVLGVKALRTSLEKHFGLPAGGLKPRKDSITKAASDCVRALQEAEERAVTSAQLISAAPSSTAAQADTTATAGAASAVAGGSEEKAEASAPAAAAPEAEHATSQAQSTTAPAHPHHIVTPL